MLKRYTSSLTLAAGVTATLLLIMQALVVTGRSPMSPQRLLTIDHFVRVPRPPEPDVETVVPPERPDVTPPPDRPVFNGEIAGTPVAIGGSPRPPALPRSADPQALALTDGGLLVIVAVAPNYPPDAVRRNLEGYVVVEYTVTEKGSVRDVRVRESTDRVFERAAIEAAYKFRYRPQIVNGEPIVVPGVQQSFRFVLDH